jgi:hypothetical protein
VPALDGWLVTPHDLAMRVTRDPQTFTVDDPRFSTGQVVGRACLRATARSIAATARRSSGRFVGGRRTRDLRNW